jgi:DnaJ-class molecular chaperone
VAKRDYYEVLGVPRDADEDTIKQAFQGLARDWHPDVSDAPQAQERFRELAEAYTVLANAEARALYDRHGYRGRGNGAVDEAGWAARDEAPARADHVHAELELRSFEAEEGTRRIVTFRAATRCQGCMGRGVLGPDDPEPCPNCGGSGTIETRRRLKLRIPPGAIDDGALLRVAGEGNEGAVGSLPGDLLVHVRVLPAAKDPRAVRYLALALLVVALAALAFYVFR